MKLQRTIYIQISDDNGNSESTSIDLDLILRPDEIQSVFMEGSGEMVFKNNMKRIAVILKNVPDEIIENLSGRSYELILNFF